MEFHAKDSKPETVEPTTYSSIVDPRESMRLALPEFIQPALTALTGKPYVGQKLKAQSPWDHLRRALLLHLIGAIGTSFCVGFGTVAWVAVPLTLLMTLSGARLLRNVIMHQCAHDNFIRGEATDHALGKAISILLMTEEFDHYKVSHIRDHHSSRHQTRVDPTVAFLFDEIGLRPGMSSLQMWKRLAGSIFSPNYHLRFLWRRIASHFQGTTHLHRFMFGAYLMVLAGSVEAMDAWELFAWSWVLPMTFLYHQSTALRLASRHIFTRKLPSPRGKATLGAFTLGIFIGEKCPPRTGNVAKRMLRWILWCTRMICFHVPCRLGILVGDGPVHDFHHRFPRHTDWANYIAARSEDEREPGDGWPPYREVWGLHSAIQATFESLSTADPSDYATGEGSIRKSIGQTEE